MNYLLIAKIFLQRKMRTFFEDSFSKKDISSLKNKDFVIISNNCYGGQGYQWLKTPYNTPFVGLFLYGPCYLKLLKNFSHYIHQELKFVETSIYPDRIKTYPIGKLGDIEIHFTHYKSEEDVRDKWNRRKVRMLQSNSFDEFHYIICDRERVDSTIIKDFHQLPFKNKLSFAVYEIESLKPEQHIKVIPISNKTIHRSYNGKKLFKLTFLYFNFVEWLNSGNIIRTHIS